MVARYAKCSDATLRSAAGTRADLVGGNHNLSTIGTVTKKEAAHASR
jgi:hypothetical protein